MKIPPTIVQLSLAAVLIGAGWAGRTALTSREGTNRRGEEIDHRPLIETVVVTETTRGLDIEAHGIVVPHRKLLVSAEITGRILRRTAVTKPGRNVEEGDLLIEIDPGDLEIEKQRLEVERAQAQTDRLRATTEQSQIEAQIVLAEETLALEKAELARIEDLFANRTASRSALDASRRSELAARESVKTLNDRLEIQALSEIRLEQALKILDLRLQQVARDLERTKIHSPVRGRVTAEHVLEGSYVSPGTPLFQIEDTARAEIRCQLRMDELAMLWEARGAPTDRWLPPTPATIRVETGGHTHTWSGLLDRLEGPGVSEATRTVPVRIIVPESARSDVAGDENSDRIRSGPPALLQGMYVSVVLHAAEEVSFLEIPERALRPGDAVWMASSERLEIVPVSPVRIERGRVFLPLDHPTLSPGSQVVVSPLIRVVDGMGVRTRR